jgi:hypothetical protein
MSPAVNLTLDREEFNEVCNLLQLMVVLGVRLYVRGPQPRMDLLSSAFDKMARASLLVAELNAAAEANEGE